MIAITAPQQLLFTSLIPVFRAILYSAAIYLVRGPFKGASLLFIDLTFYFVNEHFIKNSLNELLLECR